MQGLSKYKHHLICSVAVAMLSHATVNFAAEMPAPDVLINNVTDEIIKAVRQDKDIKNSDTKKIIQLVEQKVLPHFHFKRMTQLAVGKSWRKATPEQKKSMVEQFRTLLVRTYSNALTQLSADQQIEYKPLKMKPDDTDTEVKTLFRESAGAEPIEIAYSMHKFTDGWKVFDVLVSNVSMVVNYRDSFTQEIRQNGIDGLIKLLAAKNEELETQQVATDSKT